MKTPQYIIIIVLTAFVVLLALANLFTAGQAGSSVGVIGGADGPTAIFLASGGYNITLYIMAAFMVALTAIIAVRRKKK